MKAIAFAAVALALRLTYAAEDHKSDNISPVATVTRTIYRTANEHVTPSKVTEIETSLSTIYRFNGDLATETVLSTLVMDQSEDQIETLYEVETLYEPVTMGGSTGVQEVHQVTALSKESSELVHVTQTGEAAEPTGESARYTLPIETIYSYITGSAPAGVDIETTIVGTKTVNSIPTGASIITAGTDNHTDFVVTTNAPSSITQAAGSPMFSTLIAHRTASVPSDGVIAVTRYLRAVQVLVGKPFTTSTVVTSLQSGEPSVVLTTITEAVATSSVLVLASSTPPFVPPAEELATGTDDTTSTEAHISTASSSASATSLSPSLASTSSAVASTSSSLSASTSASSAPSISASSSSQASSLTPALAPAVTLTASGSVVTLPASTVLSVTTVKETFISLVNTTLPASTIVTPTTVKETAVSLVSITVSGAATTIPTTVHETFVSFVNVTSNGTTIVSPTTIHETSVASISILLPGSATTLATTVHDTFVSLVNQTIPPTTVMLPTTVRETFLSVFSELIPGPALPQPTTIKETYVSYANRTVVSLATQTVTYTKPCRLCSEGVRLVTTTQVRPTTILQPTTVHDALTLNRTVYSVSYATNTATVNNTVLSYITNTATITKPCSECKGGVSVYTATQVTAVPCSPTKPSVSTDVWSETSPMWKRASTAITTPSKEVSGHHSHGMGWAPTSVSAWARSMTSNMTASCITYPAITTTQTITTSWKHNWTTICNTYTVPESTSWTVLPPPKTKPCSTGTAQKWTSQIWTRSPNTTSTVYATSCATVVQCTSSANSTCAGHVTSTYTHKIPYTTTVCPVSSTSVIPPTSKPSTWVIKTTITQNVTSTLGITTTPYATGPGSSSYGSPPPGTAPFPQNNSSSEVPPSTGTSPVTSAPEPAPPGSSSPIGPVSLPGEPSTTETHTTTTTHTSSVTSPVYVTYTKPHETQPVQPPSPASELPAPAETLPPPQQSAPVASSPASPVTPPSESTPLAGPEYTGPVSNEGTTNVAAMGFALVTIVVSVLLL